MKSSANHFKPSAIHIELNADEFKPLTAYSNFLKIYSTVRNKSYLDKV